MSRRTLLAALLTGAVSCLPASYLRLIWATAPALVATRFGADGVPNHFMGRQCLWKVV